jgi:hypothetical protein
MQHSHTQSYFLQSELTLDNPVVQRWILWMRSRSRQRNTWRKLAARLPLAPVETKPISEQAQTERTQSEHWALPGNLAVPRPQPAPGLDGHHRTLSHRLRPRGAGPRAGGRRGRGGAPYHTITLTRTPASDGGYARRGGLHPPLTPGKGRRGERGPGARALVMQGVRLAAGCQVIRSIIIGLVWFNSYTPPHFDRGKRRGRRPPEAEGARRGATPRATHGLLRARVGLRVARGRASAGQRG